MRTLREAFGPEAVVRLPPAFSLSRLRRQLLPGGSRGREVNP